MLAYLLFPTHHDKLGVVVPILRSSPVPERRILPVEIEAVEVVLPEELDGAPDEGSPPLRVGHEGAEPLGPLVPASDGEEGLEVGVVRFEAGKLAISA